MMVTEDSLDELIEEQDIVDEITGESTCDTCKHRQREHIKVPQEAHDRMNALRAEGKTLKETSDICNDEFGVKWAEAIVSYHTNPEDLERRRAYNRTPTDELEKDRPVKSMTPEEVESRIDFYKDQLEATSSALERHAVSDEEHDRMNALVMQGLDPNTIGEMMGQEFGTPRHRTVVLYHTDPEYKASNIEAVKRCQENLRAKGIDPKSNLDPMKRKLSIKRDCLRRRLSTLGALDYEIEDVANPTKKDDE